MIQSTISFYVMEFYKQFAAYTTQQLQEFGLSFGMMYFVIYVGKHPGCTPAEMTKNLHLDWGRTCHQVFFDWDAQNLSGLTEEEQHQLLSLLQKAARTRKESV